MPGSQNSYTVVDRDGCRLIIGQVPLSDFTNLLQGTSRTACLDPDLARMAGANIAFGNPEDLARLKQAPDILLQARARVELQAPHLSPAAKEWLATGEQGESSKAMFRHFTGFGDPSSAFPRDPGDLRRCRLLLLQVPEFCSSFETLSGLSKQWATLVHHWQEITATMDSECPDWATAKGSAPLTYELLKQVTSGEMRPHADTTAVPNKPDPKFNV